MCDYAKFRSLEAEIDSDSDPEFSTKTDRKLEECGRLLRAEVPHILR
jgi:lipopolysaccharide/colanic/teichoic acid biosynthesis glycosyltransferase